MSQCSAESFDNKIIPVLRMDHGCLAYHTINMYNDANFTVNDYIGGLNIGQLANKTFIGDFKSVRRPRINETSLLYPRTLQEGMTTSNKSGIKVETSNGRVNLNVHDYFKLILEERPSIVVAMAHEVPIGCKSKHILLSKKLTKEWFDILIDNDHWNNNKYREILDDNGVKLYYNLNMNEY